MQKTARTKLSERHMHWEETYTERTISFKEMYEDIIGEGSYYRWEGKDLDSGDEYFVVLSPANMKKPKARWFTGCRKLPSDWAAGGKYFSEIKEAMNYANETWGVSVPSDFHWGYDSSDLKGIGNKMDDWREEPRTEANNKNKINKLSKLCEFPIYLHKDSGAKSWLKRESYIWFSADQLKMGDDKFEKMAEDNPKLLIAKNNVIDERSWRRGKIEHRYGEEYANANFYQSFLGVGPEGLYIVVVSPYLGKVYEKYGEAKDKLGVFRKKLNILTQKEIDERTNNFIAQYVHKWGVQLLPEDVIIKGIKASECTWALSKSGIQKAKVGKTYQDNLNYYKEKYGVKNQAQANTYFQKEMEEYTAKKLAFDKAYAEAQKTGKVIEFNIPPPPSLNFKKPAKSGSQQFTAIYKEEYNMPKGLSSEQKALKYGFDSFQEALSYTVSKMSSDFPAQQISTINVTFNDLKALRKKNEATKTPEQKVKETAEENAMEQAIKKKQNALLSEMDMQEAQDTNPLKSVTVDDDDVGSLIDEGEIEPEEPMPVEKEVQSVTPEVTTPEVTVPKTKIPKTKTPPIKTAPTKDKVKKTRKTLEDVEKEYLEKERLENVNKKSAVNQTIFNLVKLAEALDNENKPDDAEEVHKILRKHTGN